MKLSTTLLALALVAGAPGVYAQTEASEVSANVSALPVAVSVIAPLAVLTAGVTLTAVSVQASATGTVWVLERASDGARASVRFTAKAIEGSALVVGQVITVTALAAGQVLSAGGKAIAFVPNELGRSLSHNERIL
jgi:hypothetical protein